MRKKNEVTSVAIWVRELPYLSNIDLREVVEVPANPYISPHPLHSVSCLKDQLKSG